MNAIRFYTTLLPVIAVMLVTGCSARPVTDAARQGSDAPVTLGKVSAIDIKGVRTLLDDARGKPVVVNFWATWCAPCVAEIPDLAAFYVEYGKNGVDFIALSLDGADEIDSVVRPFVGQRNVPFPVYVLAERDIDAISEAVKHEISGALPTTIVYDSRGAVKKVWEGAITRQELESAVKPLL